MGAVHTVYMHSAEQLLTSPYATARVVKQGGGLG